MALNSQWGPPLWRILHTLAERLGRQGNILMAADEARTWVQLLRGLEGIMPCQMCRNHFRLWRVTHPVETIGLTKGPALRTVSREWLWELHEQANRNRGVEGGVTLESVEGLYGSRTREDLQQDVDALMKVLTVATQLNQINPNVLRGWKATLSLIRRLISW